MLAAERETAIALTAVQHERDAQSLVERLAVPGNRPHAIPDAASLSLQLALRLWLPLPAADAFELERSLPHVHASCVLAVASRLGKCPGFLGGSVIWLTPSSEAGQRAPL